MKTKLSDKLTPQSRLMVKSLAWFSASWVFLGIGILESVVFYSTLDKETFYAASTQTYLGGSLLVPIGIMAFCAHILSKSAGHWEQLFTELHQLKTSSQD